MKKLTDEEIKQCYDYHSQGRGCGKTLLLRTCNELLEYKAREKELGIDLIKICSIKHNQYVYMKYGDCIKIKKCHWFEKEFIAYDSSGFPVHLPFNSYGKLFALTKEELEK